MIGFNLDSSGVDLDEVGMVRCVEIPDYPSSTPITEIPELGSEYTVDHNCFAPSDQVQLVEMGELQFPRNCFEVISMRE